MVEIVDSLKHSDVKKILVTNTLAYFDAVSLMKKRVYSELASFYGLNVRLFLISLSVCP